jgi:hypothetical protein
MCCWLKNCLVFLHQGQVDSVYIETFFIRSPLSRG